jgi:hypothetical protein
MGELELPQDFKEFLKLLRSHGVKYLLIGGYAVSYHGYVRPTGDMDIWILPEPENVARIIDALGDFGFGSTGLSPELFLAPRRIVRIAEVSRDEGGDARCAFAVQETFRHRSGRRCGACRGDGRRRHRRREHLCVLELIWRDPSPMSAFFGMVRGR